MIKKFTILLLMVTTMAPLYLWGQENSSYKTRIEKLFARLAASKADTTYAVRNSGRLFIIKPKLGTSFGEFNFRWEEEESGDKKTYGICSVPIWKAGANFSYRNLTVGFQTNIGRLFGGSTGQDFEYSAAIYGMALGGDFFYNTSNRSMIMNDDGEPIWDNWVECFQMKRLQANGYYVFNNKRFSYPAAFTQSYRQKKSCGSFLVGLSFNYGYFSFDPQKLPVELVDIINDTKFLEYIKYTTVNLNFGYAYNWVIGRHWLLHGSLLPSFSVYKESELKYSDSSEKQKSENFIFGCICRVGVLWDNRKHFSGFNTVLYANSLSRTPEIADLYCRIRMFYGFRF